MHANNAIAALRKYLYNQIRCYHITVGGCPSFMEGYALQSKERRDSQWLHMMD